VSAHDVGPDGGDEHPRTLGQASERGDIGSVDDDEFEVRADAGANCLQLRRIAPGEGNPNSGRCR
jgi:hypothetical protein